MHTDDGDGMVRGFLGLSLVSSKPGIQGALGTCPLGAGEGHAGASDAAGAAWRGVGREQRARPRFGRD